jgi:phage terminase small subunit
MAQKDKDGLTIRQHQFVSEYLVSRNGTKAALAAGYSEKRASTAGAQLLANPVVRQKIDEKTKVVAKRAGVDAQWVIDQLMAVAGQEDVAQSTKVRALELLAKHLGMLEERLTVKTDGLTPEQRTERVVMLLERARSRVGGE